MPKKFVPYPELDDDLTALGKARAARSLHYLLQDPPSTAGALERLLAAFEEPECGARICQAIGATLVFVHYKVGEWVECVCRQPRGHDGPHIPDLPAECWRMPDE